MIFTVVTASACVFVCALFFIAIVNEFNGANNFPRCTFHIPNDIEIITSLFVICMNILFGYEMYIENFESGSFRLIPFWKSLICTPFNESQSTLFVKRFFCISSIVKFFDNFSSHLKAFHWMDDERMSFVVVVGVCVHRS